MNLIFSSVPRLHRSTRVTARALHDGRTEMTCKSRSRSPPSPTSGAPHRSVTSSAGEINGSVFVLHTTMYPSGLLVLPRTTAPTQSHPTDRQGSRGPELENSTIPGARTGQREQHSPSALVGWIATVLSRSSFVAPIFTATAKPCMISSEPKPRM